MRPKSLTGMSAVTGALVLTLSLCGCYGEAGSGSGPGPAGGDGDAAAGGKDGGPPAGPGPCPFCKQSGVGSGQGSPFDPKGNKSASVGVDGDGALSLSQGSTGASGGNFMWVADTDLPGVVKIDLDTLKIVGRYRAGGSSTSRTTINVLGEAFVGARESNGDLKTGVTKILPHGKACPDTNGDGKITTSSGPDDVLPWGQDDCVAWHTQTEGDIRGLAAQDVPGKLSEDVCKNFGKGSAGVPDPTDAVDGHYIWIGGLHGKIYKLDARTGKILMNLNAPSSVYGLALSGDGRIWTGKDLAFVDIQKCTDEATCNAAPVCTQDCNENKCPATCDSAVKARINGISGYGITVDYKKRVWMSDGPTKRYDPNAPADQRLHLGPNSGGGGIAADADGWVWAATNGSTTVRVQGDSLQGTTMEAPSKGVAVDRKGRILTVYNTGVHLIEAKTHAITKDVVALKGFAYAYSDMTGIQTQLASDLTGWYRQLFAGCSGPDTQWHALQWNVEVPAGTWVIFKARAADDATALAAAPWRAVACISSPGGQGQAAIDMLKGKLLEVEVRLSASQSKSAKIKSFDVTYACEPVIE